APLAVLGSLHFVRDHHMRVQMRVTGPGVVVIERGRDNACDVDLRNRTVRAGCTDSGGCNLPFDERNHLRNRRMMRLRYQGLCAGVSHCPEHTRRLRDRERVIESRRRPPGAPRGLLRLDDSDLAATLYGAK